MDKFCKRVQNEGFGVSFNPPSDGKCFFHAAGCQLGIDASAIASLVFSYLDKNQYTDAHKELQKSKEDTRKNKDEKDVKNEPEEQLEAKKQKRSLSVDGNVREHEKQTEKLSPCRMGVIEERGRGGGILDDKPTSITNSTDGKFRNNFFEVIEELRLRRTMDLENEMRINTLLTEKHQVERQWEEEISKNSAQTEKHEKQEAGIRKQYEEQLQQYESEKEKYYLTAQCNEKEMNQLKDEVRALHLARYNTEKKAKALEREIQLQVKARRNHETQLTELEQRCKEAIRQGNEVFELVGKVEVNVSSASRLHKKLMYTNQHHKCLLNSYKRELEARKQELANLKMTSAKQTGFLIPADHENCGHNMENRDKELRMQTELCRQLQTQLDDSRKESKSLMDSLKKAHNLVERHVEIANNHAKMEAIAQLELDQVKTEYQNLEKSLKEDRETRKSLQQELQTKTTAWHVQKEDLEQLVTSAQAQYEALTQAHNCLEERNSELCKHNQELTERVQQLSDVTTRLNNCVSEKETALNHTTDQIDKLEKKHEKETTSLVDQLTMAKELNQNDVILIQQLKENVARVEIRAESTSSALLALMHPDSACVGTQTEHYENIVVQTIKHEENSNNNEAIHNEDIQTPHVQNATSSTTRTLCDQTTTLQRGGDTESTEPSGVKLVLIDSTRTITDIAQQNDIETYKAKPPIFTNNTDTHADTPRFSSSPLCTQDGNGNAEGCAAGINSSTYITSNVETLTNTPGVSINATQVIQGDDTVTVTAVNNSLSSTHMDTDVKVLSEDVLASKLVPSENDQRDANQSGISNGAAKNPKTLNSLTATSDSKSDIRHLRNPIIQENATTEGQSASKTCTMDNTTDCTSTITTSTTQADETTLTTSNKSTRTVNEKTLEGCFKKDATEGLKTSKMKKVRFNLDGPEECEVTTFNEFVPCDCDAEGVETRDSNKDSSKSNITKHCNTGLGTITPTLPSSAPDAVTVQAVENLRDNKEDFQELFSDEELEDGNRALRGHDVDEQINRIQSFLNNDRLRTNRKRKYPVV